MTRMRNFVLTALRDPSFIYAARKLVGRVATRDEVAQARALRLWMAQHFRFVKDPDQKEDGRDPRFMMQQIAADGVYLGDCDDAATLSAALGKAIGLPAKFMAVAFAPNDSYKHVYTVLYPMDPTLGNRKVPTLAGRRPMEMDVTRPASIPRPKFARRMPVTV